MLASFSPLSFFRWEIDDRLRKGQFFKLLSNNVYVFFGGDRLYLTFFQNFQITYLPAKVLKYYRKVKKSNN